MKIGFMLPMFGPMATHENMINMAQLAEERGFESVWAPDHVIMPTKIDTYYPYNKSGTYIADPKGAHLEPFTSLSFIAGCTHRVRLGFTVIVAPYRNPIVTGKMMASLDVLSNGRLIVGAGAGWLKEEFDALEVPFGERGRRMDEGIELMKLLWTQDRVDFSGDFYRVDGMAMEPKPLQKPHPPLWFGGTTAPVFRRVVEHGTGWLSRPVQTMDEIAASFQEIRRLATQADRDPGELRMQVSVALGPQEPTDEVIARASGFAAVGATDVSFFTSYMAGIETVGDHVAQLERAMTDVVPAIHPAP